MSDPYVWVVRRIDQGGGWLAESGSEKAYTHSPANARRFRTYKDALAECCENECAEVLY